MKITLFSVEEAHQAAEEIRPLLEGLVKAKHELDRLLVRIDVLSVATTGASVGNPDARTLAQLTQRRNRLAETLQRGIETIHERGCIVKDLDRGLVDFYSLAGDRLIFLCWQLGEAEIGHWHSIEGGFASRQPLNKSEQE